MVTSQPQSQRARERQRANVSEKKSEAQGLPNKGALCKCGHVTATATTELEQSWPGFPQSRSLVLHSPVVFPARGLSISAGRESRPCLPRGLVVARSGGPPRLLGTNGHPQGPSARVEAQGRRNEVALPGRGWELQVTRALGLQLRPRLQLPPNPPSLASGPWGS